jgi:hypothetical protein
MCTFYYAKVSSPQVESNTQKEKAKDDTVVIKLSRKEAEALLELVRKLKVSL